MTGKERILLVGSCLTVSILAGVLTSLLFQSDRKAYAASEQKSQDVQEIVRARKFGVYDSKGKVRALMSVQNGRPIFLLGDDAGKSRLTLALTQDGSPIIAFADAQGRKILSIMQNANGTAGYVLLDNDGKPTGALIRDKNGQTALSVHEVSKRK